MGIDEPSVESPKRLPEITILRDESVIDRVHCYIPCLVLFRMEIRACIWNAPLIYFNIVDIYRSIIR